MPNASQWPSFKLNTGAEIPAVGLGTFLGDDPLPQEQINGLVETAVRAGYRHFDGALIYGNEPEIGIALARVFSMGLVKREDIFYTSKCPTGLINRVREAIDKTLSDLGLEYLDLYLLHWPICGYPTDPPRVYDTKLDPVTKVPIQDPTYSLEKTWRVMEELVAEGKVRAIGVANYTVGMLEGLLKVAKIPPAVNQYEAHPYLPQPTLLSFCHSHSIHVTAYSPLGAGTTTPPILLTDATVASLAASKGCTPAQLLINWSVARGCSVIPRTSNVKRLAENFVRVELEEGEMAKLAEVKVRKRYVDPNEFWKLDLFGEAETGVKD
ncbi:hypothetical protein HDU93_002161 [Gonapodya sp. JEL0774]|nr:hypothetical protein HDU93_002161 [Gonapodya sp. JEL0774]